MQTKEELDHRVQEIFVAIADGRHLLNDPKGRRFFKHLLRRLDILFVPSEGVTGEQLAGILGRLRVGNELFQLLCQADHKIASEILAEIEGERRVEVEKTIREAIDE